MAEMSGLLDRFLDSLLSLFPLSPFTEIINTIGQLPWLGYLNWFLPVGEMLSVGAAWLSAVALYYLYSVVARWIKLIS